MTTFHSTYLLYFCVIYSKYWMFIFSTYPKPFIHCWKIWISLYKINATDHTIKFFSRACLSKTMIIYDRLYQGHILLRCNSCFRKRNASCYICKFLALKQEKQQKYAKFDLFQYFVSCSKYLHWIIESQKSQLIILIYRIKLCTIMSIL